MGRTCEEWACGGEEDGDVCLGDQGLWVNGEGMGLGEVRDMKGLVYSYQIQTLRAPDFHEIGNARHRGLLEGVRMTLLGFRIAGGREETDRRPDSYGEGLEGKEFFKTSVRAQARHLILNMNSNGHPCQLQMTRDVTDPFGYRE